MGCRYLFLAGLLFLAGCRTGREPSAPTGPRRLNLLLVTIDTLRADRLGCYGYSKVETPNLDRVARNGVLFENAIAQAPLTAPSHASMMTGLYPTVHQVRDTGGFVLSAAHPTIAALLRREGWDTAAFVGSSVLKKRFGFGQGFDVYDDRMGDNRERPAGEVVDRAVAWLGTQSGKPFFLWIHVYDPHLPYTPPSPFREKYAGRLYDGEVAYTDQQLGRLFDAVHRKSPDTLIVVLADHGEAFSEHGEYAHGVFLYDTTLHIPFLIAGPGVPAGTRVKSQVRTIDLLPTLLELVRVGAPQGIQGVSLAPAFAGKEFPAGASYVETLFPKINMGWAELRAVRTGRWKYISAPKPELYDLAEDPAETRNVIGSHPAEARAFQAKLKILAGNAGNEKVRTGAGDPKTMVQLQSLGYLSGSSQQVFELTGKGTDPKDRTEVLRLLHFAAYSDPPPPLPRRVAMLRQALTKDPANPALYSSLGEIYREAGLSKDEMQLYRAAAAKRIQSSAVYSRLGSFYLRGGTSNAAIPLLEAALRLNPADFDSAENLAVAYRQTGRTGDSERVLDSIIQSGEEYPPAYNERGMTAYQKGDMAGARIYFEKAAQLDAKYQFNLGRLYKMAGEAARARACFEAFLAAPSSDPEYKKLAAQVKAELAGLH